MQAIADGGRGGEVRYLGEFSATEATIRKLVAKLAAKYRDLMFRSCFSLPEDALIIPPIICPRPRDSPSMPTLSVSCRNNPVAGIMPLIPPPELQTIGCQKHVRLPSGGYRLRHRLDLPLRLADAAPDRAVRPRTCCDVSEVPVAGAYFFSPMVT
jgi:hypothetical protein